MRTQEKFLNRQKPVEKIGEFLTKLSAVLLAIAIPTSIALDNLAVGIGILGLLLLLISRAFPLPPFKPILILLLTEIPHYIVKPSKIFKSTDLKQYLTAYFIGFKTGLSKDFLKKISIILGVFTTLLVLSLIFEALTGQNIKQINLSSIQHLHLVKELYRPKGFLNHPLTTGGVLFSLFFFFFVMYSFFKKRIFLLFSIISLVGIVFNQSRSYWLGITLFIIVVAIGSIRFRKHRKIGIVSLLLLTSLATITIIYPPLKNRLISITDVRHNGSNKDRLVIWLSYYYAFKKDYSPLELMFGTGDRATQIAVNHGKEACLKFYSPKLCQNNNFIERVHRGTTHNIYIKYLSKYGIIGLLAFLLFWGYALWKNLKEFTKTQKLYPLIFAAGYIGFMLAGFFENNFTDAEVQTTILFILGINFALLNEHTP